jgi:glucokinase
MTLVAGVDIGGTNISVAVVDDRHQVVDDDKVSTPAGGPEKVVKAIAEVIDGFEGDVDAVGVGAPGPVNDGVIMTAPNLEGWSEPVPLARMLAETLGLPVTVGNDANVGTVGEWVAGAARGARFVLGVWAGTGVGGGLVLDGRPFDGAYGGGGEFGHMIVRSGGALCGCGRRGCIEAYAGRACMEHMVDVAAENGEETKLFDIMKKKDKDRLTSSVWAKALEKDDPLATRLIDDAVEAIGIGVGSVVNLLDLDCVVVGGGLAEKLGQRLADRIHEAARPWMLVPDVDRRVVVAQLADDSGVVGAAELARRFARMARNAAMPA